MKLVLLALVMVGAVPAAVTVSVKDWVTLPAELVAVMVMEKVPLVVGVPARVAVPYPESVKMTPVGRVPVSLRLGVGVPVVVTVKLPAAFWVKVVLLPLVMAGGV